MKERATRLWRWVGRHRVWSSIILMIVLLAGVGVWVGTYWTANLVRFGLPPPIGQNCGRIIHADSFLFQDAHGTFRADATLQSLACFWQAYQTCKSATISQTYSLTDAGYTDTVTIEQRNNHCALYGQDEWGANAESGTVTFLCTRLSKAGDGLQVSACDGTEPFQLVPRDVANESFLCGEVGTLYTEGESRQIEACFFTAYQQCLADSLVYVTSVSTERDFFIDNHCGIAYWSGVDTPPPEQMSLSACASLAMRADGLHFSRCGTDGDIFVPLVPSSAS